MSVWAHKIIQLHSIQTSRQTSKIKDIDIMGDIDISFQIYDYELIYFVSDCYQTNQAAKAEGITYEDMRLREKAQGLTK